MTEKAAPKRRQPIWDDEDDDDDYEVGGMMMNKDDFVERDDDVTVKNITQKYSCKSLGSLMELFNHLNCV